MTSRRGFLQTIGAALGSTVLPAGAVASVVSAAPVAEVAAGVMAVAAVARQFKTTRVLDADTFEPCVAVAITENGETHYLPDRTPLVVVMDELMDNRNPDQELESEALLELFVIEKQLKQQGLPPLTNEETAMIKGQKKEIIE
jgi:hypothetical protein